MTFVLAEQYTFNWPVKIILPDTTGKQVTRTFTGHFKLMEADEFNSKTRARFDAISDDVDRATAIRTELVMDVMTGWEGVVDEDNNPVPFSLDTLKHACRYGPIAQAIFEAYKEALTPAGEKARRKGN